MAEVATEKTTHFLYRAASPEQLTGSTESIYVSCSPLAITVTFSIDLPFLPSGVFQDVHNTAISGLS